MSRLLWAIALLGLLARGSSAEGQAEGRLRRVLRVERDDSGCITEPALRARLSAWLRGELPRAPLSLSVELASGAPSFTLRRAGEPVAVRRLSLPQASCADRLEALALAMSLAIEHAQARSMVPRVSRARPAHVARAARSQHTARLHRAAAPRSRTARGDAALTQRRAHPRHGARAAATDFGQEVATAWPSEPEPQHADSAVRVHLGGAWLVEALPSPLAALAAGVEFALGPRFSVALSGLASTGDEFALGTGRSRATLAAGRALGCMRFRPAGRAELEGCAGSAIGVVFAKGEGYTVDHRARGVGWVAVVVGGALRYPDTGPLSLRLAMHGLVNAVRPVLWVKTRAAPIATQFGTLGSRPRSNSSFS